MNLNPYTKNMAISLQNPLSKALNPLGNIISGSNTTTAKTPAYDWKKAPSPFTKENAPTVTGTLTGGGIVSTPLAPITSKPIAKVNNAPLKLDKSMVVNKPASPVIDS